MTNNNQLMVCLSMRVHFGGPDKPAALARLLLACIENVPSGGEIHWIAYYFGNLQMAETLLAASRRGVKVAVTIDAHPRRPEVNRRVIELLRGLEGGPKWGLRSLQHMVPCHVHEKIYYFSHPRPALYVGSYNPSCNVDDASELVEDIGDQDRGHNFLAEITEESAVDFLRRHMQAMHERSHDPMERYRGHLNTEHDSPTLRIWLYPRRRTTPHIEALSDPRLKRVLIAASHFRDPTVAQKLAQLAAAGTRVEVLCHESLRRVTPTIERLLLKRGVRFMRYHDKNGLPMHNKFILLETERETSALFGSLNLTRTSRWLNHEILMKSSHPVLVAAFAERWQEMHAELCLTSRPA